MLLIKLFSSDSIFSEVAFPWINSWTAFFSNTILTRDINDPLSIINNKTGGINVIDLANIYSCPFIATQDLGRTFDDGSFSVLGRFNNADVRGCNLLVQW